MQNSVSNIRMWRGRLINIPADPGLIFSFFADEFWYWLDDDGHDGLLTQQADDDMLMLLNAAHAARP